jgi:hypothetical protein
MNFEVRNKLMAVDDPKIGIVSLKEAPSFKRRIKLHNSGFGKGVELSCRPGSENGQGPRSPRHHAANRNWLSGAAPEPLEKRGGVPVSTCLPVPIPWRDLRLRARFHIPAAAQRQASITRNWPARSTKSDAEITRPNPVALMARIQQVSTKRG